MDNPTAPLRRNTALELLLLPAGLLPGMILAPGLVLAVLSTLRRWIPGLGPDRVLALFLVLLALFITSTFISSRLILRSIRSPGPAPAGDRPVRVIRDYLLFVILLFASAEAVLRLVGVGPWKPTHGDWPFEQVRSDHSPHPTLGYTPTPGQFRQPYPLGRGTWTATHGRDRTRITRPGPSAGRVGVWIFGCSFTYGCNVNDDETYPWLVQRACRSATSSISGSSAIARSNP